jgi:lysophospholipase L1-like esterase
MKHFHLSIFLFSFLLLFYLLHECYNSNNSNNSNKKESFQLEKGKTQTKNIIFLGDSILKNNNYVSNGESIEEILIRKMQTNNVYNYAQDDSTIHEVYYQLSFIPEKVNQSSTSLFLSIGGNDIIKQYIIQGNNVNDFTILDALFSKYKKLVKTIQEKMDKTQITLLNLYYPNQNGFKEYYPLIQKWNSLLNEFINRSSEKYSVVDLSSLLHNQHDFIDNIEPSIVGGEKIANLLLANLSV